jgi:hypothetical protein
VDVDYQERCEEVRTEIKPFYIHAEHCDLNSGLLGERWNKEQR